MKTNTCSRVFLRRAFAVAGLLLSFSFTQARADDKDVSSAQQMLKDQGFYYGEVTGQKGADTTAAIRRYQIRNGLEITGDLNEQTLKSLRSGNGSADASTPAAGAAPPAPNPVHTPPPPKVVEPDRNENPNENEAQPQQEEDQSLSRDAVSPSPNRPMPRIYEGQPGPTDNNTFAGTPYAHAPGPLQEDVIARAQKKLARKELYRGVINGVLTSDMEFSLRAYQSKVGLRSTGRLDLETLAALELLPGSGAPIYTPRRPLRRPPGLEAPVRGEWIRP